MNWLARFSGRLLSSNLKHRTAFDCLTPHLHVHITVRIVDTKKIKPEYGEGNGNNCANPVKLGEGGKFAGAVHNEHSYSRINNWCTNWQQGSRCTSA